jgi:hypothetical protein
MLSGNCDCVRKSDANGMDFAVHNARLDAGRSAYC